MDIRERTYGIRDRLFPWKAKVPPAYLSYGSVLVSLLVFVQGLPLALVVLAVLLLDAYDGTVARAHGLESRKGLLTDLSADRYSEAILFWAQPALLVMVLVNVMLSVQKVRKGWVVLPLRHLYLITLLVGVVQGLI